MASFFKKIGRAAKRVLPATIGGGIGFLFGGPVGGMMGTSMGYQASEQRRAAGKARKIDKRGLELQEQALEEGRQVQAEERRRVSAEQERIQRMESDELAARRRRRGRRSLLSEDELGVPNVRRTLG